MRYTLSAVLFLYSVTTLHMITWTFQIGATRNGDSRNVYGISYTDRTSHNSSFNFSAEDVVLETFSDRWTYNSSFGRKREILSNLWNMYHQTKERIRRQKRPLAFEPAGDNIVVLSTFYDNRLQDKLGDKFVRVLALAKQSSNDNLLCSFDTQKLKEWVLANRAVLSDGHDREFGCYMYTCMVPDSFKKIPDIVYLDSLENMAKQYDIKSRIGIRIHKPVTNKNVQSKKDEDHQGGQLFNKRAPDDSELPLINSSTIALCVPPLHGNIPISNLIQFIEIYKTLGVNHFFMYEMNISAKVSQILKHYANQHILTTLPWNIPDNVRNKVWYNGQVAAIQDCLYRTMQQSYDFAAFVDIDEIIVPKLHKNLHSMMNDIENRQESIEQQKDLVAAFSFKSAFFDPEQSSTMAESPRRLFILRKQKQHQLSFFNALHRSAQISSKRTKLIVRPKYIEHLGIHHVSKLLDLSNNLDIHDVAMETALIHHYRTCTGTADSDTDCSHTVFDNSIIRFEKDVQKNYDIAVEEYIAMNKK